MTLEEFYPYILVEAPGCPDPLINLNLVAAAIEFCTKSLAWTAFTTAIPLVEAQSDYVITAPADAQALMARDVWVDGSRMVAKTADELAQVLPNWQTDTGTTPAYYNSAAARGSIRVYPKPVGVTTQALTMRAAFIPTPAATALPDFLGQYHMEAIASGAKARLLNMPNVQWSNIALGVYHRQIFDNAIVDARIVELHDRVQGSMTVAPRRFG